MIDIQPNDFNSMQAQAIRFAREMQQKATPQQNYEPIHSLPPKHHNNTEKKYETPFCKAACPIKNLLGMGGSSGGDNDIMLLMALLLVLTADGGDKMLMMALLYIMT